MYDILIKNGTVIDGTGKRKYLADVGVKGERIAAVGDLRDATAHKEINAAGWYVTPGFIDITTHSDAYWTLFESPSQASFLAQGVTTIIGGVCGSSIAPLLHGEAIKSIQKWSDPKSHAVNWLRMDELAKRPLGVNFGTLAGHATLRRGIAGEAFRALTPDELEKMERALVYALEGGAFGLSTGLSYSHARHATLEELVMLAHTVKRYKGLYHTHLRHEGSEAVPAVQEALQVARESGVATHLAHLKVMGEHNWHLFPRVLAMLEEASGAGMRVSFDCYPYTATASVLYTLLPEWATDGGKKAILERLNTPGERARVITALREHPLRYRDIVLAQAERSAHIGRSIAQIAHDLHTNEEETLVNMLLASANRAIVFADTLSEENVRKSIRHALSIISSSSPGYDLAYARRGQLVHPRAFGAFAHILGEYVRERAVCDWEEGVHKMSGRPAQILGLRERGTIQRNAYADLVVLDPHTIAGRATFANPYQFAQGVGYVLVNGSIACENGEIKNGGAGRVLRRQR